tara:strand:- start:833 stop:988 length:156 start_codon:yes stop_codon:yes gene_type:complete
MVLIKEEDIESADVEKEHVEKVVNPNVVSVADAIVTVVRSVEAAEASVVEI